MALDAPLHCTSLVAMAVMAALVAVPCGAKTYQQCELAKELKEKHGVPDDQLATWVCIAWHESRLDTSAVGRLSGESLDLGIFQISDLYWCGSLTESPSTSGGLTAAAGGGCGVECLRLIDDDITDDVRCARHIFREHSRYARSGWSAWAVYMRGDCTPAKADKFIQDCFQDKKLRDEEKPTTIPNTPAVVSSQSPGN